MKKFLPFFLLIFLSNVIFSVEDTSTIAKKSTSKQLEVVILAGLPASGKSELRHYLSSLSSEECLQKYRFADTVQLDDFPYVHMMRRISDEMTARGQEGTFFLSPALPFKNPIEWATLIELINEDFYDLTNNNLPLQSAKNSAANWIFDRLDAARKKLGTSTLFDKISSQLKQEIAKAIEADAQKILKEKIATINKGFKNKTIVIEFSRGGPDCSTMPLPAPLGYQHSLSKLSADILKKATLLYVKVSPEESRRKNEARADPNDPGSILNHCVPRAVMYADYGCDDIAFLLKNSSIPNTIEVKTADNKTYHLPCGVFDNVKDKTTFLRKDYNQWENKDLKVLSSTLKEAFDPLTTR